MSQSMMSVSSLNTKIKSLLEATFMHSLVEGEVASVTYHTSGHLYFSIKDDKSSIKCVMWRSSVIRMKFRIEKGMHIVVEGSVSVYTPRGEYQFQTVRIEPYGQGALALAYEQLKKKLKEKGYFSKEHKKEIPKYIQKIALVTAKDSAALHDMLKIIEKRWAMVDVTIVDTLVQGKSAATQIVRALQYADALGVDVVVVGRGGGSAEDLWSFNEEKVADAIYVMHTPVVSAVGHEVDVLISDFVADLRAPTPSAAIEMILPDIQEILYTMSELSSRFEYSIEHMIEQKNRELSHYETMLVQASPSRQLEELNTTFERFKNEFKNRITTTIERYDNTVPILKNQYTQNIQFVLNKKMQEMQMMQNQIEINNPKRQYRKSWAKVSIDGKSIELSKLKENMIFKLEDEFSIIEAKCVKKL
jgi:exodeoxyribonuclease VII large subunit